MLSAAKVPLFFWVKAIATTCFTQNRSLVIPRHEKTPYHIINDQKPSVKFFHIFGSLCYIIKDGENLDKMKENGDACIFVGYSTQSNAYRVFNNRTGVIAETIHVNFDELPQMASDHVSSDPVTQCQRTALVHDSLSPDPQCQENFPEGYVITQEREWRNFVTSLIHIESHKSPTMSLFDVDSNRISIFIVNAQASLRCSGKITRMMRRTLDSITSFHIV
nr:hypothetical protein [Tanacetum cinerariifolium]